MEFSELVETVIYELQPDGDSSIALPTIGDTYAGEPFGDRVLRLLQAFTVDTFYLWTANQEITVEAGDREFSFLDDTNCDLSFFHLDQVWLANLPICRKNVKELLNWWLPTSAAGRPWAWAQLDRSSILFNVEVDADIEDCSVQGYYRHPAVESDEDSVLIAPEDVFLFTAYASANLRRNVASDEVGLARLQSIHPEAARAVVKLRGERMRRMW
jgi:hypothetical protein